MNDGESYSAGLKIKGVDYPFLPYMAGKRKNTKNRAPRQKGHQAGFGKTPDHQQRC